MARVDASLAMNFVGATPTEHGSRCSSRTRRRMSSAIPAGRPSNRCAPDTSRNASSRDSGSTSGVTSRKIRMTARDAAVYSLNSGGRKIASGQSRRARAPGIALRTP